MGSEQAGSVPPRGSAGPVRRWLLRVDPANARESLSHANDGILTIAGTSLGLAGAEIGAQTSYTVLAIGAVVGTLSTLSVQLTEEWNTYEAEQDAVAHEQSRLLSDPEGEVQELIDWFEAKGVSPVTARQMASELSDGDALDIQLALEYGIQDPMTRRQVIGRTSSAALAFLLGALLPILLQMAAPFDIRSWLTMTIAAVSLTATALAFSSRGHYRVVFAIVRALCLGLGMLALTYTLGDLLM
ncbi:MAG: VIT1/CCC1 transporter family protein [Gordonia sp. (in: high G+C Gram-positive bacteria)]|uniref:VIT1/CCC1 transporter family protein n=1 Tax=Gordonia sp. (in: high G+C Gram-positive bacteria) TaxID=84139 RepID=UPI003BB4C524